MSNVYIRVFILRRSYVCGEDIYHMNDFVSAPFRNLVRILVRILHIDTSIITTIEDRRGRGGVGEDSEK